MYSIDIFWVKIKKIDMIPNKIFLEYLFILIIGITLKKLKS